MRHPGTVSMTIVGFLDLCERPAERARISSALVSMVCTAWSDLSW